ncbi:MAG: hypothetical protein RQ735_02125 [Flavobacteriaceae bacterium]|nr:hypothetical protein [Flavobacteriaceae bacterium]
MKKKILLTIGLIVLVSLSYVAYLWFQPHRDVQATKADAEITAQALVGEFIDNPAAANQKYLDSEGESKVLIISGQVVKIDTDQLGQKVVLLKNSDSDKLGVACTFTLETNAEAESLKVGETARIKGVIRSGAEYDEDLDLVINAVVEKSSLAN